VVHSFLLYRSLLVLVSSLVSSYLLVMCFFFFTDTPTPAIYTLSLHDALPIWFRRPDPGQAPGGALHPGGRGCGHRSGDGGSPDRSEEHTSELQSRFDLVCRLLLEKKKKSKKK